MPYAIEGSGDILYDDFRNVFWCGYTRNPDRKNAASGRTDKRAHKHLTNVSGVPCVSLELCFPFFHLDTVFAPLPNGEIIYYPEGITRESQEVVESIFERSGMDGHKLVRINKSDALRFACNLVAYEDVIFVPKCDNTVIEQLKNFGYDVKVCDVSSFIHAGGAIHCMTNPVRYNI
jgi:N-dimethylarginine dimethylaminohydrolase